MEGPYTFTLSQASGAFVVSFLRGTPDGETETLPRATVPLVAYRRALCEAAERCLVLCDALAIDNRDESADPLVANQVEPARIDPEIWTDPWPPDEPARLEVLVAICAQFHRPQLDRLAERYGARIEPLPDAAELIDTYRDLLGSLAAPLQVLATDQLADPFETDVEVLIKSLQECLAELARSTPDEIALLAQHEVGLVPFGRRRLSGRGARVSTRGKRVGRGRHRGDGRCRRRAARRALTASPRAAGR